MKSFYPDKAFHLFDKLLEQPQCLFQLNTENPDSIYQRLSRYNHYTGKAFYSWNKDQGLYRADIPNIFVPNTMNIMKALKHISISIHFGIYLFTDYGNALNAPIAVDLIKEISENNNQQKKLLIFADHDVDLPHELSEYFTTIKRKSPIQLSAESVLEAC